MSQNSPMITIICDGCGIKYQVVNFGPSKTIKGHYCNEECWIKSSEKGDK